ncbi:26S proteasome non-ATPase regulatory subunit 4, partial [Ophiophagus hannah]
MRIIAFVGSPVEDNEKDLVKLAKRLKKEKVNVDIINFGEEEANTDKLTAFINTLNGKDGTGSHLVTVPPGPSLADALISSPILAGEGGAMLGLGASDFEFGVDPSADPELALNLGKASRWRGRARLIWTRRNPSRLTRSWLTVTSDPFLPQEEDDYDVMQDPEFLQSVLENLPGVDPNNEAIRNAMGSLASQASKESKEKKEEDKK